MGLAASVGRAIVIAATVEPKAPIETHRDRWNAIGTGCTNAKKWIYPLMSRPVDHMPGIAVAEPFHKVRLSGDGLNTQERSRLFEVVMTVRSFPFISTRSHCTNSITTSCHSCIWLMSSAKKYCFFVVSSLVDITVAPVYA